VHELNIAIIFFGLVKKFAQRRPSFVSSPFASPPIFANIESLDKNPPATARDCAFAHPGTVGTGIYPEVEL